MENAKLKEFEQKTIEDGWGCMHEGHYPRPIVIEWLEIVHPDVWEEYKKWFDEKVRR